MTLTALASDLASTIALASRSIPRTYRVEHKRDLHPGSNLDWRLYTYGDGHWCVGTGHSGTFSTEAEAMAAGEQWIATGGQSRQALAPVRRGIAA